MATEAYEFGNKSAPQGSKLYGSRGLYGRDAYQGTISLAHARVRIGDAAETRWQRMFLYGVLVWMMPFVFSYGLLWLDDFDHHSYLYTMSGIAALTAIVCGSAQLRPPAFDARVDGLLAGLLWLILKLGLDLIVLRIAGGDALEWIRTRALLDLPILLLCVVIGFYYHVQHQRLAASNAMRLYRAPVDFR